MRVGQKVWSFGVAGAAMMALAGCMSETTMGGNTGPATGSAGPNGSTGASAQLEKCDRPLGIIALVEVQDAASAQQLASFGLGSPLPVLRLLMQQSNCFQVVDRGQAMQTILQERQLAQGGETRTGANMGSGQMVAADLALTPNVLFSGNTGGGNVGLGFLPGWGGVIGGAIDGGLKFTSAQTVLTLTDVRSTLQVASSEGSATAKDFNIGAGLFGASLGGSFGAYGNTPEGKVVTAALMDGYNKIVRSVRAMPPLPSVSGVAQQQQAAAPGARTARILGNYNLRAGPGTDFDVIGKVNPGTQVTLTGKRQGDWVEVSFADKMGWLQSQSMR